MAGFSEEREYDAEEDTTVHPTVKYTKKYLMDSMTAMNDKMIGIDKDIANLKRIKQDQTPADAKGEKQSAEAAQSELNIKMMGMEREISDLNVIKTQQEQIDPVLTDEKTKVEVTHREMNSKMKVLEREISELNLIKTQKDQISEDPTDGKENVGATNTVSHFASRELKQRMSLKVSFPKLQMDASRANADWCHVTAYGELVNLPVATQGNKHRLQNYHGTCSTSPFLPSPHTSPSTFVPDAAQYWETHATVGVLRGKPGMDILEIGLVEERHVDTNYSACPRPRYWCIDVEDCEDHTDCVCTSVWQRGRRGACWTNTMSNRRGALATLHYGVVLDVGRGRLAYIDLDRGAVLAKVDEEFGERLFPMFGVGRPGPDRFAVKMKLITGEDVDMTDRKTLLICEALK